MADEHPRHRNRKQQTSNERLHRYALELQGYDFTIADRNNRKGVLNVLADFLSRFAIDSADPPSRNAATILLGQVDPFKELSTPSIYYRLKQIE